MLVGNIRRLFPGYFAMVMATGIIAIGAAQQEITWLGEILFVIAAVAYVVLALLLGARVLIARPAFVADLTTHAKGFAFLTTVAATNVLASAAGVIHGWWDLAYVMWWASIGLWALLAYSTLFAVVLKGPKPGLGSGINGTWFLLTVSIESIVALGALLIPKHNSDLMAFGLIAGFLVGVVLYLIVMTMVFLRWTFHELDPKEADPPAWIAAGALAITVLAGSNLLRARLEVTRIEHLAIFLEGFVILAWATSTFWFPLMIAIGVWRHVINRVPLRYHPSYWAMVFPLGMYGASSFRMLDAIGLDHMAWLPKLTLVVALVAWSTLIIGLGYQGATAKQRRAI